MNEPTIDTANNAPLTSRWRLDNRRALVTGATKGIGLAIADELLTLGARVVIAARNADEVHAQVAEWTARGLLAHGVAADVATPNGREAVIAYTRETLGGLDILVNNVGTNIRKATTEYTDDEIAHVLNTNLLSAFGLCRDAYPLLQAAAQGDTGDAVIVNIGSVAGMTAILSGAIYAMTKAALDQLTRYLAVEWGADGVRVNSVNPWYTETPLASVVLADPAFRAQVIARTPLARIAAPEDVAGLAAFLCLPAARHITGQTIAVDGGFMAYGFRRETPGGPVPGGRF